MSDQRTGEVEPAASPEALRVPNVEAFILTDDGIFPNNGRLPLLIYKKALNTDVADLTAQVQALFAENHWSESWIDGIFGYHHYHSKAHEVLAVCSGQAEVRFGGEHGITCAVSVGDVVVIPAGVAHKNFGSSDDFVVVGAYPQGQNYDLCHGWHEERPEADKRIVRVPRPEADPLYGPDGPLMEHWTT